MSKIIAPAIVPYSSVHYMVDPNNSTRMIKSEMQNGQTYLGYQVVSEAEMQNLLVWLKKYYANLINIPETIQAKKTAKRRLFN